MNYIALARTLYNFEDDENNGMTGPTGEATKSSSNEDTSGEDNQIFCNGVSEGKMRKKGKQPVLAAKMTKIAAATGNTTSILEPIGIIIPKMFDKPKDDDDEKISEIPNMNSPLFKDIPAKKVDSSSDLSSSSGGSSSSEDSSSSDDDSDDEEEETKDMNTSNNTQQLEPVDEPQKLRTPIKLTISNLGKSSAKVISSASRKSIDSNSSDSITDVDDKDVEKDVIVETNPSLRPDTNGNPDGSHIAANLAPSYVHNESLKNTNDISDTSLRHSGTTQQQNNTMSTDTDMCVGDITQTCNNIDLLNGFVFQFQKSDNSDHNFVRVNTLDLSTSEKENLSLNVVENGNLKTNSSKEVSHTFKSENSETVLEASEHLHCEFVSKDSTNSTHSHTSKKLLSAGNKYNNSDMDLAPLRDSFKMKYCQDEFLFDSSLSNSSLHLNTTLKASQDISDSFPADGATKDGIISETETSVKIDSVNQIVNVKPSEDDYHHATTNTRNNFLVDSKQNLTKDNQSVPHNAVYDKITERSHRISPTENAHFSESQYQNESSSSSESTDKVPDISCVSAGLNESSYEILPSKLAVDVSRTSELKCRDSSVSCQSLIKSTATKMTTSINTTTTNSGSIMSPTSENITKSGGFTNGIPDRENPFITWTKLDDPGYGLANTSIPTSSLVQTLARVPFPLALPREPSMTQISPLCVNVTHMSPLVLAGLSPGSNKLSRISPGCHTPLMSSPNSQRVRSSPSHNNSMPQLSPPLTQLILPGSSDGMITVHEDDKSKTSHKSVQRTSRLSNIIDSLRTSKEKQAAGCSQISPEQDKKGLLDVLHGTGMKSPSLESSSSVTGHSSASPSPVFSASLVSDPRSSNEKLFSDNLGFSHQIGIDVRHLIKPSLESARVHTIDKSFNILKDDLDKGKKMLESLEMVKNKLLDPYSKQGISDTKSRKLDSSNSQNRSKSSPFFSSPAALPSVPSSSSRPSSRQSTKSSSQSYPSASPSLSTSRTSNTITTSSSSNLSGGGNSGANINSAMFHAAPSNALAAAHMELNAAAANILTFQHLYGMQDPYMMKTLMSNPMYLQRMMEFQKQAIDPIMLRQLEMYEAAAAVDNSRNCKEQQAAINAQSILWQTHAASILQHQQMQQIQQFQLHHQQQQQLQQHVAAARERETRETIAAIMTSKSNILSNYTNKSSGSISTGQSAKSLTAPASVTSSFSSASPSASSSKRPRSVVTPSLSDIYSRDAPSLEKKLRQSHQTSSHIPNHSNYTSSSSSSNISTPSSYRNMPKPASSSNVKSHTSDSVLNSQSQHNYLDFPAALQLTAGTSPHLWGYSGLMQPASVDLAHMSQFFERPNESPSSLSVGPAESEATGAEVLDLSVKPRTGKT